MLRRLAVIALLVAANVHLFRRSGRWSSRQDVAILTLGWLLRKVLDRDVDACEFDGLKVKIPSVSVVSHLQMRRSYPFHREIYRPPSVGDVVENVGSGNRAATIESQHLCLRL